MLPYEHLRWIGNDPETYDPKALKLTSDTKIVQDFNGNLLLLFSSPWNISWALDHNDGLELREFSENTF